MSNETKIMPLFLFGAELTQIYAQKYGSRVDV